MYLAKLVRKFFFFRKVERVGTGESYYGIGSGVGKAVSVSPSATPT
jgi:hypothetical protein